VVTVAGGVNTSSDAVFSRLFTLGFGIDLDKINANRPEIEEKLFLTAS
jgi:hypothetical protein